MRSSPLCLTLCLLAAAALTACGGGGGGGSVDAAASRAEEGPDTVTLSVQLDEFDAEDGDVEVLPQFHAAAVALDEPGDAPAPQRARARAGMATARLTPAALDEALRPRALAAGEARPMAASTAVTTYTPAQIRAAYGLPSLATATAAQLGAGQTIYIVNARHDPHIAAELAAFNAKFALPACTTRTLAADSALPLPAASGAGCELVVAYSAGARLAATPPAYDSAWATEIALDVQWAHATAPLARIVLIEAPDANVGSLANAVALANRMGPGVVSMSFAAPEGSWTAGYDGAFSAAGMSYVAATGDHGAAVSWPSASGQVLAVGGTTLAYDGSGARAETAWSGTGGGTSAFVALPAYQSGLGGHARRAVADVAFNADPNSGQYVALMSPGTTAVRWISAGGTSLATPQWAGLLAIANAMRAAGGRPPLGAPHAALYQQIAALPAQYAAAFLDVASGSNGPCAGCAARAGHDIPTGWGTPQGTALLARLGAADLPTAGPAGAGGPRLTTAQLTGVAGRALGGSLGYSAPGASALTIRISGAPAGMAFSASRSGIAVRWAQPVMGSIPLLITLKDNLGRTSTGTVAVNIGAG